MRYEALKVGLVVRGLCVSCSIHSLMLRCGVDVDLAMYNRSVVTTRACLFDVDVGRQASSGS